MVLDDAEVGVDVATDKQIVRFCLHAVVVMQHKEELLLIDSLLLYRDILLCGQWVMGVSNLIFHFEIV